MRLYFIRHGQTLGNREHRYVGRTDEGILEMEKALKHNEGAGERPVALAKQLIELEEKNVARLKSYL